MKKKSVKTTRRSKPTAAWKTPAVRARCVEAAEAATMPTFRVDDAMKSDEAMIQFAEDSGESLDWLVRGLESHRRCKPADDAESKPPKKGDRTPQGIAFEMENPLDDMNRLLSALLLVAQAEGENNKDGRTAPAIFGLFFALDDAYNNLYEQWDELFHALKGDGANAGDAP